MSLIDVAALRITHKGLRQYMYTLSQKWEAMHPPGRAADCQVVLRHCRPEEVLHAHLTDCGPGIAESLVTLLPLSLVRARSCTHLINTS